jgi:hypothetical protein
VQKIDVFESLIVQLLSEDSSNAIKIANILGKSFRVNQFVNVFFGVLFLETAKMILKPLFGRTRDYQPRRPCIESSGTSRKNIVQARILSKREEEDI